MGKNPEEWFWGMSSTILMLRGLHVFAISLNTRADALSLSSLAWSVAAILSASIWMLFFSVSLSQFSLCPKLATSQIHIQFFF